MLLFTICNLLVINEIFSKLRECGDKRDLVLNKIIGQGSFGTVYESNDNQVIKRTAYLDSYSLKILINHYFTTNYSKIGQEEIKIFKEIKELIDSQEKVLLKFLNF